MIQVVILGAGNVAIQLHKAFANHTMVQVVQGYNRSYSPALERLSIPQTQNIQELKKADVYIIAVSDNAISAVTDALPFEHRLVVHTSGSTPMEAIAAKNRQGVFYPLQTFTANITVDFSNVPICLEAAHSEDMTLLKQLANAITTKTYQLSSAQRNVLHVAAVFANNFSNLMYIEAKKLCDTNHIPFEILHPLIMETATKIQTMEPMAAQTGPARRNDDQTIERHLNTIQDQKQQTLYKLLTDTIQQHYGKEL